MTKISSGFTTFFVKKGFPTLWFGFLAFFVAITLFTGDFKKDLMFLIVPCLMAVLSFFLMKKLVWVFVDDVYDCGDFLLVKNRGEEDRVMLSNVMNVSAPTNTKLPRITLRLVEPGKFGAEIVFLPTAAFTLNPFAQNQVAEDLIARVYKARLKRAV